MFKHAQSRILFLLLMLAAPLAVCAQSQDPSARFSVVPGNPVTNSGFGFTGENFTFTAYVDGAVRYQVDYDDGSDVEQYPVPGAESTGVFDQPAVFQHPYKQPRNYEATLQAWNEAGDLIIPELRLTISVRQPPAAAQPPPPIVIFRDPPNDPVQAPPPVVPEQWPPVRPAPTVRAEPKKPDILPWLLLAAIAILLSQRSGLTGGDPGTFETTTARGTLAVIGSADAVSMRVRRKEPEFVISDDAVVLGVQPGRPATRVDS